jgi:hypothetical protein
MTDRLSRKIARWQLPNGVVGVVSTVQAVNSGNFSSNNLLAESQDSNLTIG